MDRNIPNIIGRTQRPQEERKTTGEGICSYCGKECDVVPFNDIIGDYFKEVFLFLNGNGYCQQCAYVLTEPKFRNFNWIFTATQSFPLKHEDVWVHLIKDYDPPYVISLTTTHKKHNLIYGHANYDISPQRWIAFDSKSVVFNTDIHCNLYTTVHNLYNNYLQSKRSILTGEYNVSKLTDEEYSELIELERGTVSLYRGTNLLDLLTTYVQKGKE